MSDLPHELALGVSGKIGEKVYQRVRKGKGNIRTRGHYDLQLRAKGTWTDRRSPAQIANRRRLAAATQAYQALDDAQKAALKLQAKKLRLTGYNLFVRQFCATHPISDYT